MFSVVFSSRESKIIEVRVPAGSGAFGSQTVKADFGADPEAGFGGKRPRDRCPGSVACAKTESAFAFVGDVHSKSESVSGHGLHQLIAAFCAEKNLQPF